MDSAEFAAAMAPVERHLRSLADDMCCPLLHLGRHLAITRDDFLADEETLASRALLNVYIARDDLSNLIRSIQKRFTFSRAAQLATVWRRVIRRQPLPVLAVLGEVRTRLATPQHPKLARVT
jgi:hypothetical protein